MVGVARLRPGAAVPRPPRGRRGAPARADARRPDGYPAARACPLLLVVVRVSAGGIDLSRLRRRAVRRVLAGRRAGAAALQPADAQPALARRSSTRSCTLFTVVTNPYTANAVEWFHAWFLTGGALIVGWAVGRAGRGAVALTLLLVASCVIAVATIAQGVAAPARPSTRSTRAAVPDAQELRGHGALLRGPRRLRRARRGCGGHAGWSSPPSCSVPAACSSPSRGRPSSGSPSSVAVVVPADRRDPAPLQAARPRRRRRPRSRGHPRPGPGQLRQPVQLGVPAAHLVPGLHRRLAERPDVRRGSALVVHRPVPRPSSSRPTPRSRSSPRPGVVGLLAFVAVAVGTLVVLWRLDPAYGTLGTARRAEPVRPGPVRPLLDRGTGVGAVRHRRHLHRGGGPGAEQRRRRAGRRPHVATRSAWRPARDDRRPDRPRDRSRVRGRRRGPPPRGRARRGCGVPTAADHPRRRGRRLAARARARRDRQGWRSPRGSSWFSTVGTRRRPALPAAPPRRRRDLPQRRPRRRRLRQPRHRPGRDAGARARDRSGWSATRCTSSPRPATRSRFGTPRPHRVVVNLTRRRGRRCCARRYPQVAPTDRRHRQRRRHAPAPAADRRRERRRPAGAYGFGPDDVVVLFVGHEFDRKGLPVLVEAVAQAPDRVRLLVVGGTPDLARRRPTPASEAAGCEDRVHPRRPAGRPDARPSTPRTSSRCPAPTSPSASSSSRRWPSASRSSRPTSACVPEVVVNDGSTGSSSRRTPTRSATGSSSSPVCRGDRLCERGPGHRRGARVGPSRAVATSTLLEGLGARFDLSADVDAETAGAAVS